MAIGLHLKCCECNILSKTQRWKGWSGGRLEDARGFSWKYLGGNSASPPRRRLKKHTRHSRLFFLTMCEKSYSPALQKETTTKRGSKICSWVGDDYLGSAGRCERSQHYPGLFNFCYPSALSCRALTVWTFAACFSVSYQVWSPIRAFQDCLVRPL